MRIDGLLFRQFQFQQPRLSESKSNNLLPRPGRLRTADGTIDFYLRIRTLINSTSIVLDLGAGRAEWFEDDHITTRREIRNLSDTCHVIAADVDKAVLTNKASQEQAVIEQGMIPLAT